MKLTLIYQKGTITEQLTVRYYESFLNLNSNIQCLAIDTPNQNEHISHIIGGKGLLWSKALENDLGSEFTF